MVTVLFQFQRAEFMARPCSLNPGMRYLKGSFKAAYQSCSQVIKVKPSTSLQTKSIQFKFLNLPHGLNIGHSLTHDRFISRAECIRQQG